MISTEEVFQACRQLLSKDKAGYFSSDEFNDRSKRAEIMLWNFYVKHFEEHGRIADAMHPFHTSLLTALDSNATFSIPSDFGRRMMCWRRKLKTVVGSAPTVTEVPIGYLEREEVQETVQSAVRGPSASKDQYYYSFSGGKVQIYPTSLSGVVKFEYLRLPTFGERGYTIDVTNLEEDPNSGTTIDYEWPEHERANIEDLILLQYGVMIKSNDVLNWASSQIADARNQKKL